LLIMWASMMVGINDDRHQVTLETGCGREGSETAN
jgi:hypothetical protein